MRFVITALSTLILASHSFAAERSYTDDLGVTHTTTIDKPTIVTFAHTAVSLFDYGTSPMKKIGDFLYINFVSSNN